MKPTETVQRPEDVIDDATAAAAFRRLLRHLRHRADAQNIDLMGLAGFCRNCLADWVSEASHGKFDAETARHLVYGMPYGEWKARNNTPATPEQIAKMEASMALNRTREQEALDEGLDQSLEDSFPASDPPSQTDPSR
ncbi:MULTISPECIES: DUF1244 domain-containing protein [Sphingomonadales]|uniref:DUF1244 domain-containing protein n=2 Tax=Edaphosphingomonas TaxID=3423724 RepID=A0A2T4I7G4_9SPHN|nr:MULTISPECIES: DUF1244 domain-containing protein [Sphingomonas]AGH50103.1 hypothetical protein G432_11910 [Sphingomonas sp. MM-1]MDX3883035.1 DUF1244 domain-containing protein [Sphingomonas sp.]OHT18462.1 hypothetical protein BHE75_00433 [Sphingomonas haloaromaticamans]PTD27169.1 DUF1244 domain-containing protein [Sphingomonas fennica]